MARKQIKRIDFLNCEELCYCYKCKKRPMCRFFKIGQATSTILSDAYVKFTGISIAFDCIQYE